MTAKEWMRKMTDAFEAQREEDHRLNQPADMAVFETIITKHIQMVIDERMKVVNRLAESLRWCSGSQDFNEGGIAREGWQKGPAEALKDYERIEAEMKGAG